VTYLWVALGGALGSMARFWLTNLMAVAAGAKFPWGTLLINVLGSLVIGFFALVSGKIARFSISPDFRVFVMVGICGGFTTFSAFSLQTVELLRAGEWNRAIGYCGASLILCPLACWLGILARLAV
jgi:CrcB protein